MDGTLAGDFSSTGRGSSVVNDSRRNRELLGRVAFVIALASGTMGCGHRKLPMPALPDAAAPTFLSVLTEGVVIEAEDGSWDVASGDPVRPPFGSHAPGDAAPAANGALLEKYGEFVQAGARHVRVRVPGRHKPLYGVLALLPVYSTSTSSSARRTFRIEIPNNRIQEALGGQVSVIYEPYPYSRKTVAKNQDGDDELKDSQAEAPSWILWVSDAPFAGGSAGKSKMEEAEEAKAAAEQAAVAEKAAAEKAAAEKAAAEKAAAEKAEQDRIAQENAAKEEAQRKAEAAKKSTAKAK
jgi:hypothetical protein